MTGANPSVNTDVLKTFCELVETGSFSRTAEANYISQSAVSQQLAKLERVLGVELISRGGGVVAPTEAGRSFYKGAREMLRRFDTMLQEVRSTARLTSHALRVGTVYSVGFYFLEPFARRFLSQHGEVNLHVEYTTFQRIYDSLLEAEIDLGLVACPEKHRSLEVIRLVDEPLVAVCSPKHRLAGQEQIAPRELRGESFIAFDEGVPTRRHIDRLLKRASVQVRVAMEFDNVELLKRAIEVGAGMSILPMGNVQREVGHGHLWAIRLESSTPWVRPVGVVRRRGRASTQAERLFLQILRSDPAGNPAP